MNRIVATAFLTASVFACSLVRNTNDLGGGPVQGAIEPPTPPTNDPTEDSATTTPRPLEDAAGGGGPESPCKAGTHLFCDDFDTGNLGDTWTVTDRDDAAGALSIDTATFRSAPNAMRLQIQPFGSGPARVSALSRDLVLTKQEIELSADLRIEHHGTGSVEFLILGLHTDGNEDEFQEAVIAETSAGMQFRYTSASPGGGELLDEPITLADNAWHHITLKLAMGTKLATVIIDGTPGPQHPMDPTLPITTKGWIEAGAPKVRAGDTSHVIHVDNVVVD